MSLQIFTDPLNEIYDTPDALSIRDKRQRVGFKKTGETTFTV